MSTKYIVVCNLCGAGRQALGECETPYEGKYIYLDHMSIFHPSAWPHEDWGERSLYLEDNQTD